MLHQKIPGISLTLLLLLACLFPYSAKSDLMAVRGDFENTLQVPPGTNPLATLSSSATCFGGNVGDAAVADGSVVLEQSSFYQIVSCNIPYPSFVEEAVNTALGMLYWDKAPPEDREDAAFVYKVKMYDKGDAEQYIKAQFADIADFWDNSRRARAMDAPFVSAGGDAGVGYVPDWDGHPHRHARSHQVAVGLRLGQHRVCHGLRCTLVFGAGGGESPVPGAGLRGDPRRDGRHDHGHRGGDRQALGYRAHL